MYIACQTSKGFRRQSLEDTSVNSRMAVYTTSRHVAQNSHLLETSEPKEERRREKGKTRVLTDHQTLKLPVAGDTKSTNLFHFDNHDIFSLYSSSQREKIKY